MILMVALCSREFGTQLVPVVGNALEWAERRRDEKHGVPNHYALADATQPASATIKVTAHDGQDHG